MKAWRIPSRIFSFDRPIIMGILNLTPDSFSDGGKFIAPDAAFRQAEQMVQEGADILDLGAESTRPGAESVSAETQLARLLPVFEKIKKLSVPISIDTTRAEVAEACLRSGAEIINDVSGLRDSAGEIARVVARYKAGLILMHRRGNAQTMQKLTVYEDLIAEVKEELAQSVALAVECGVSRETLVMDPGFGFSKTAEQNLFLLKEIKKLEAGELPLLLGVSRKSFIGQATGRDVSEREFGSAACIAHAHAQGVRIFRVHDVRSTRDTLSMLDAIQNAEFKSNARAGCL